MEPMRTPPVSPDLVDWLQKNYPPRCIGADEPAWMAHRYSAQVELAQRLIKFGTFDGPEEYTVETQ